MIRLVLLMIFACVGSARAACDWGEQAERSGRMNIAVMQYMYCAEEENDAQSQYRLGTLFYKGEGLKAPDYRRSAIYYAMSARNGYAPAQVKLGLLYWRGEGLVKNMKMAHKWLYLAQEPAALRWFYPVGASSDPVAAQVYSKINQIAVSDDAAFPLFKKLPVSYAEVAAFQHEKLLETGEKVLSDFDLHSLRTFMENVKPDIDLPPEEMKEAVNLLKPAVLTEKNFDVRKVPVLEKMKKTLDARRAGLN